MSYLLCLSLLEHRSAGRLSSQIAEAAHRFHRTPLAIGLIRNLVRRRRKRNIGPPTLITSCQLVPVVASSRHDALGSRRARYIPYVPLPSRNMHLLYLLQAAPGEQSLPATKALVMSSPAGRRVPAAPGAFREQLVSNVYINMLMSVLGGLWKQIRS